MLSNIVFNVFFSILFLLIFKELFTKRNLHSSPYNLNLTWLFFCFSSQPGWTPLFSCSVWKTRTHLGRSPVLPFLLFTCWRVQSSCSFIYILWRIIQWLHFPVPFVHIFCITVLIVSFFVPMIWLVEKIQSLNYNDITSKTISKEDE